jgi:hypothetical protein
MAEFKAAPNLARTPQFGNREQVALNSSIGHMIVVPPKMHIIIGPASYRSFERLVLQTMQ